MDITLSGPEYKDFMDALIAAYPIPSELDMMFQMQLGRNLWTIAPASGDMRNIVFSVIRKAQSDGWTAKLLTAALSDKPDNDRVRALAAKYGFGVAEETNPVHMSDPSPALQRMIQRSSLFVDAASFLVRMAEVERQVCRVEVPVMGGHVVKGTGFLVGPSTILTNYHVVEPVILGEQGKRTADGLAGKAADVIVRFDYKRTQDGLEIDPGLPYHLAKDWLIDVSPESKVDTMVDAGGQLPAKDELDYAFVRLESDAGNHAVGQKKAPSAEQMPSVTRGWVSIPTEMPDLESDKSVLIMQHPFGSTLKLAIGTDAIVGLNDNHTRLRYATSTEEGSSGSPVFNINWELIALHHLGDPNFERPARYNQGIPITQIRRLLSEQGKLSQLA